MSSKGVTRLAAFFVLVGAVSTAACSKSASGPTFVRSPIPAGQGVVQIYRPSAMAGGARSIYLSVPAEANNCFALDNGGFLTYVGSPGVLNVGASGSGERKLLPITLGPGAERYVRVEWGTWGGAEMKEVSASEGMQEIAESRGISACEQ